MIGKLTLGGSLAAGIAALGLAAASVAHAQPYYGSDYGYDQPTEMGGVVVRPERRAGRTYNGLPTERVYARRVVDVSDLDLNTYGGVRELRYRVEGAAADACDELSQQWTQGLYPVTQDADCRARAVRHAMAEAPIGPAVDADYTGY